MASSELPDPLDQYVRFPPSLQPPAHILWSAPRMADIAHFHFTQPKASRPSLSLLSLEINRMPPTAARAFISCLPVPQSFFKRATESAVSSVRHTPRNGGASRIDAPPGSGLQPPADVAIGVHAALPGAGYGRPRRCS